MNAIKTFMENMAPMSHSDWKQFSSQLTEVKIKSNTVVSRMGKTENNLYFMTKGIVRIYIPGETTDLTFGFIFENQFVTAYDSFITQTASKYEIESLTEITLWKISYNELQAIYSKTISANIIGRKMAENMFLIKSNRELSLLNKTAEQRYLDLFSDRPELLQHIPLKYIASYIGVTPQALSRIRKRIT